jgi:hypothetical protein
MGKGLVGGARHAAPSRLIFYGVFRDIPTAQATFGGPQKLRFG